jgi:hypothetical protein
MHHGSSCSSLTLASRVGSASGRNQGYTFAFFDVTAMTSTTICATVPGLPDGVQGRVFAAH